MFVVIDVVLVDESANDVVLKVFLQHNAVTADDLESLIVHQVLHEKIFLCWWLAKAAAIEIEVLVADCHFPFRRDDDLRNVDRSLGNGAGHALDHRSYVYRLRNTEAVRLELAASVRSRAT